MNERENQIYEKNLEEVKHEIFLSTYPFKGKDGKRKHVSSNPIKNQDGLSGGNSRGQVVGNDLVYNHEKWTHDYFIPLHLRSRFDK